MSKLTTQILNELAITLFNEEGDTKVNRVVAIYPGRFQPMGLHHAKTYEWMVKQFGKQNSFIVTSNKVETPKSPFNFEEKKKIMKSYGINNVVRVKSPYFPVELLEKLDPKTTAIIYILGEKDAGRLSSYKRLMKYNRTTLIPYKDIDNPYAYYVNAPNVSINIPGFGEMSGTQIRNALGDEKASSHELKERFKAIFGKVDADIYNLVVQKLQPNRPPLQESVADWATTITAMGREQFKMFVNIMRKETSDTRALIPLINKWVRGGVLSKDEKRQFKTQMIDIAKIMGLGSIAVAPFPGTTLLIPIIVSLGKKFGISVLPEQTASEMIVRREFWNEVFSNIDKQPINEGGAAGHMTHPFEDYSLTFGDIKQMFKLGLSGRISIESDVTEKVDGYNLFVTFKGNNILAARNGSDLKRGGMSISDVAAKFEGRGEVADAFNYAVRDLQQAFRNLTPNQRHMIFKGGTNWVNLEVMHPSGANVINYDGAHLVFHGISQYNEHGEKIKDYPEYAKILSGMIKQVNAHVQQTYNIQSPKQVKIDKSKDFSKKLNSFNKRLTAIQDEVGCVDTDTLGTWHKRWWANYIKDNSKKIVHVMDPSVFEGLVRRWGLEDKSYRLNAININDPDVLSWAKNIDKNEYPQLNEKNKRKFEELILEFGAEVLTNARDFIAANPESAKSKILSDLDKAIATLSRSSDPKDLAVLDKQLSRIQAAGGMKKIVPIEGIVFKYNGKIYKLTGLFAPVNQLLSYFKFGK